MKPGLVIGLNKKGPGLPQNKKEVMFIERVANHVTGMGWDVIFEKSVDDCATPSKRQVLINSKKSRKTQLISLLHEAGHIALFQNPEYLKRYPFGYFGATKRHHTYTLRHKIDVMREEIAAWDEAEKIIDRLNIEVNMKDFWDHRNRSLLTYAECI